MRQASRILVVVCAVSVIVAPFLFLFSNSVKPAAEFSTRPPVLWPTVYTLEHWRAVFDPSADTLRFLMNSLLVTAQATALAVVTGTLAAYGLARLRLPFKLAAILAFVFLFVRFYPKITVALPYFLLAKSAGLLDTKTALVLAHASLTLPFVVWLMLGFFQELPRELEESAVIDGATVLERLWHVVLPLSAPALVTAAVLTAILSWNEFLLASTVAPNLAKTLPVRISAFITDKGTLWGPMSAMGTVIVLPVTLFALLMQRWLVRGLTMGAVKE